jgi:hypothetical protein
VNLVNRIERKTGQNCPVGIGIPGSLEPKSRLGKGASSTWLLGRPVERDLQTALGRVIRVENDAFRSLSCSMGHWKSDWFVVQPEENRSPDAALPGPR